MNAPEVKIFKKFKNIEKDQFPIFALSKSPECPKLHGDNMARHERILCQCGTILARPSWISDHLDETYEGPVFEQPSLPQRPLSNAEGYFLIDPIASYD